MGCNDEANFTICISLVRWIVLRGSKDEEGRERHMKHTSEPFPQVQIHHVTVSYFLFVLFCTIPFHLSIVASSHPLVPFSFPSTFCLSMFPPTPFFLQEILCFVFPFGIPFHRHENRHLFLSFCGVFLCSKRRFGECGCILPAGQKGLFSILFQWEE